MHPGRSSRIVGVTSPYHSLTSRQNVKSPDLNIYSGFSAKIQTMRRRLLYLAIALIAALAVGWRVHHVIEERTQKRREIDYQKTLRSYSEVLKTGMTRKEVEDYLSTKKIRFRQMCCVTTKEFSRGVYDDTYDDLVKIAQEDVPWVCSENNVYVAFQFLGRDKNSLPTAEPSDILKDVTVYHWLEGCM